MNNSSEKVEGHYAASKHKDKDTERTGNDKSEAQIQCYIVFKVPKATTAPMQQDIRALSFRNLQLDKTGGVTYCNKGGERR